MTAAGETGAPTARVSAASSIRAPAASAPALSVVIPNYRRPALLRRCLRSVLAAQAASAHETEVIVVDDGSGDESCELVRSEFPGVQLVALERNRGYAAAVNAGIARSAGGWILTLNNDTTIDPELFDRLLEVALADPGLGLAAAEQRFSSQPDRIYSAGTVIDGRAHASDRLMGEPASAGEDRPVEVFGACGAAALYRRAMLAQVGCFDELFRFGLEDADLAWRARMCGWRCVFVPGAIVYHDLGGTIPHGSRARLYQAGRNRWLLIAKNLDTRQLWRALPAIVAFDLAYIAYACPHFRTLAPIRGRIAGLRLWRAARAAGAQERAPVQLTETAPLRAALARRRAWRHAGSAPRRGILFVNQYAPPDTASTGRFAFEVARAVAGAVAPDGARVTFLAGQPSYSPEQPLAPRHELLEGVEILRLRMLRRGGRRTRTSRLLGYAAFLLGATVAGPRVARTRGVETVVCFHNPPLLPLIGALLARRGRRLITVVLDIHPDVLVATRWISLPASLLRAWDAVNRFALRNSDRIVVLSDGMKQVLVAKGIDAERIDVIPIWAEPELEPQPAQAAVRARLGAGEDELLVLFTGNLGITQQLEPVIETVTLLSGSRVRLCFVGASGIKGAEVRKLLARQALVSFLPFQSESSYKQIIAAADAAIVTLAPGLEQLVVPSRAFPLLSAGVPLLAVMSPVSELGELVRDYGAGVCSTDPHELAATLSSWQSDRATLSEAARGARTAYLATRSRATLTQRYVEVVRDQGQGSCFPATATAVL